MTRVALFQSNTGIDPAANARALEQAIAEAAGGGAEMLFTPEMSGLLDRDSARAARNLRAEDQDEVLAACREAAHRHRIWLHIGSLAVLTDNGKVANRGFIIDREGEIRARYDKLHLFDVDLPTGESWRESNVYSPGSGVVLVNGTPVGKLGLTICYDLRFPGLFARLAEADADLIAVPAAFTVPTGRRIGTSCFARARSRRGCSSSPRRRSGTTRTGATRSAIRSWSTRGERCCSTWARSRASGLPTSTSSASRTCARGYRRLTTAGLSRTR